MMGAMGMGAHHGAFPLPFPPLFRLFAGRGGAGGCGAWKRGECGAWGKRAESTTANSAFVCDVTLPDGAEIPVGAEMVKTWKFRNDGSQPWPQGTTLVLKRCRGEFETAPLPISRLPNPGEEVEVSATLKALQPGRGRVCYRLVDNTGAPFGRLWADVNAIALKEEEVKAEPTPVKVEPTPVKVEPTTPKVEPTTPKVDPEPVKAESPKEPETPKPHKWEIALTALANMGFVDRKLNIKILNKEKGNLERTITRLLDGAM
jgi:cell division septation protein DedD